MIFFKKNIPFLIFLLITLIILVNWFRYGTIYGGGEIGVPTVNVSASFEISKFIWWDRIAPGFFINYLQSGISLLAFLSIFELLGFSPFYIQIFLFGSILFLMGVGVYILFLDFFGKNKKTLAVIAGLFYMVNPYMMVMVWHRFVFTTMVFAAALPFLFYFWKKWIENRTVTWLFLFILGNFVFSYSFGTPGFVITLWILLATYTFLFVFIPWLGVGRLKTQIINFSVGFLCWLLTNAWWFLPVFTAQNGILQQGYSSSDNLYSLTEISKQSILPFSLPMLNPFYIYNQNDFGNIYMSSIFLILPWIMVGIFFCGIFFCFKRKNLIYLSILFLISLFFAKGLSPPFNYLLTFLFEKFRLFGVIRNPFEKIGILLPLFTALLFACGIFVIYNWMKNKQRNLALVLAFSFLLIPFIYCFPMFFGNIFTISHKPALVKVPDSYAEADKWIKEKSNGKGRILHVPFTGIDTVTYKWSLGYHGIDPTPNLFTSLPSLSRPIGIDFIDRVIDTIPSYINNYESSEENILALLQKFNISFIVLHYDIHGVEGGVYNTKTLANKLNTLAFFDRVKDFGEIGVYRIADQYKKEDIFLTESAGVVIYDKSETIPSSLKIPEVDHSVILLNEDPKRGLIQRNAASIFLSPKTTLSENKTGFLDISKYNYATDFNKLIKRNAQKNNESIDFNFALGEAEYFLAVPIENKDHGNSYHIMFNFFSSSPNILNIEQLQNTDLDKDDDMRTPVFFQPVLVNPSENFLRVDFVLPRLRSNTKEAMIKISVIPQQVTGATIATIADLKVEQNTDAPFLSQVGNMHNILDEELRVTDIIKKSPTLIEGSFLTEKPQFIFFKEAFNLGWELKLIGGSNKTIYPTHLIGDGYGNAWYIENPGTYKFIISFKPQEIVNTARIISATAVILLGGVLLFHLSRKEL